MNLKKTHLQLFILHYAVEDPMVRGGGGGRSIILDYFRKCMGVVDVEKGLSESAPHLSLRKELPSLESGISLGARVASSPSAWPPPRRGFLSPRLGEGRGPLRPSHREQLLSSCQLHQSHAGEMATERRRGFRTAPQSVNQAGLTGPYLVCSITEPQQAPTSM